MAVLAECDGFECQPLTQGWSIATAMVKGQNSVPARPRAGYCHDANKKSSPSKALCQYAIDHYLLHWQGFLHKLLDIANRTWQLLVDAITHRQVYVDMGRPCHLCTYLLHVCDPCPCSGESCSWRISHPLQLQWRSMQQIRVVLNARSSKTLLSKSFQRMMLMA